MKGLLIKDFKLLKNQKQFFGVIGLICIMFLTVYDNIYFVVSYMTIMFSMFTVSTIIYDEYDNGSVYLFTLPISRKSYVKEKYMFGIAVMFSSWIVIMLCSIAASMIRHLEMSGGEVISVSFAALTVSMGFIALSIPIQLKFGAERARMATLLVTGIVFVIAFAGLRIIKMSHVSIDEFIDKLQKIDQAGVYGILCILWVVFLGISFFASLKIMEKREF